MKKENETLKDLQKSIQSLVKEMASKTITTPEEYVFAAEWLKKNKTTQKIVKEKDSKELAEAKQKVEEIKGRIDSLLKPLVDSERIVKDQLSAYDQKVLEDKRKAEEKLRIAEEKGLSDKTLKKYESQVSAVSFVPSVNGISKRKDWTFEVVDPSQVPREYLLVDEVKLGKYARMEKENASVPGVRFFYTETVVSRGS